MAKAYFEHSLLLLRIFAFFEKNHLLYAAYAPDYDISLLLANYLHRLSSAPYILHDCRRKTMLLHNNHRYLFTEAKEEFLAENLEKEEQYIQALFVPILMQPPSKNRQSSFATQ